MENKEEIITTCPRCSGNKTIMIQHQLDTGDTSNSLEVITCPKCKGVGKVKKITVTTIIETYETI